MIRRAWSEFTIKGLDEDERTITGIATTPAPDRLGDIVEPLGIEYKNPLPFLWQHRHDAPVGLATFGKPSKAGIKFTAQLARIAEPGMLKELTDLAWQAIKAGLVRGVSIGFRPLETASLEGGGFRYLKSEVLELSAVTVPAHQDADILTIKRYDTGLPKGGPVELLRFDRSAAAIGRGAVRLK